MRILHNGKFQWIVAIFFLLGGIQSVCAQGCDYTVTIQVTHSDCYDNGVITAIVAGPDVDGLEKLYQIYPSDTPPGSEPLPTSSNSRMNLAPGTYTVKTSVHCNAGMEDVWVDRTVNNVVVNQSIAWAQANFVPVNSRKSMSCAPTGAIRVENIIGSGKGPYTFDIVSAPPAYTATHTLPYVVYTKPSNGVPGVQTFNDFPAGDYQVRFTDGCGGQV
ncbi:MAG: hypothetical protein LBR34_02190, partial [Prevotella sp.]|nr:hypothetical protein [Prevotella sp.]